MNDRPFDITAGRLDAAVYQENFADIAPPLDAKRALVDSSRCYFCYDAPCIEACPTGIDIPNFIRKIATGNVKGAAITILEENIFGGACARVCPTEILCERACVRNLSEDKPVNIGALQRYATDHLFAAGTQPFKRAASTGKRIAVVGAGPAGLACAHRLSMLGHDVTVFEARDKLGGLNEYGVAAYKMPDDFAQHEVDFVLALGGIETQTGKTLGSNLSLTQLRRDYDTVFLSVGLAGVNALRVEGEALEGVEEAVGYIARLRQIADKAAIPVGRNIIVIGGGNTAIDIAVQTRRLGAENVTIVYRRGPAQISATHVEQEFAQVNGVTIKYWAKPTRILGSGGRVNSIEFEYTTLDEGGRLTSTGEHMSLAADMVFTAIGQVFLPDPVNKGAQEPLQLENNRIVISPEHQTSLPGVFAGGDCVATGHELTVQAVQDGKLAADGIDRYLKAR